MNTLLQTISNLIFPAQCLGCGLDDQWLCADCANVLIRPHQAECPHCRVVNTTGETCKTCKNNTALAGVYILADYNSSWRSVIHAIKYQQLESVIKELINHLEPALKNIKKHAPDKTIITATPMNNKRKRLRGFNQAESLARSMSDSLELPFQQLLYRHGSAVSQSGLTKEERRSNISRDRIVPKQIENIPKSVIIVDDVYTTGATMEACAKTLQVSGVETIWGIALARGKWRN